MPIQKNLIIAALAVAVLLALAGGWYMLQGQQNNKPQLTPVAEITPSPTGAVTSTSSASSSEKVVTVDGSGFSPKEITIKVGETVAWMNSDRSMHNVSSAVHPTHQLYPPLNLGDIASGEKKFLTFPTPGNFKYHNHLNPTFTGAVIVQ